jgi:hypothetical protein
MAKHAAFADDDEDDDLDDPMGNWDDDDPDDDDDDDDDIDGEDPEDDERDLEDCYPTPGEERVLMARCADEMRGILATHLLTPEEHAEMAEVLAWYEREAQRG